MHGVDVTVMAPAFAQTLFLLSPALHWAVLIYTNGWYGCEELKSRRLLRVSNATNFATRLRRRRVNTQPFFHTSSQPPIFTAFKGLGNLLDLERSQKVDLGMYRFQGPIQSLSLEGKGLRRAPIGVITIIYLVN